MILGKEQFEMKFTKMHGCGNDYIYVDCTKIPMEDPSGFSVPRCVFCCYCPKMSAIIIDAAGAEE